MILLIFLISLTSSLVCSESGYNNRLLPYVKQKFQQIDDLGALFGTVNKSCVMELLEVVDDGENSTSFTENYSNLTAEILNLMNATANKACEVCTEEFKVVLTDEEFVRNLRNHKSLNYTQKISCFKNEYFAIDPQSNLLSNSNIIFNEENCREILADFELKLMKGFKDYRTKAIATFNLQVCDLDEVVKIGRKIALRYVLMANGEYPFNEILTLKNELSEDAKKAVEEVVKCFVNEMKSGAN